MYLFIFLNILCCFLIRVISQCHVFNLWFVLFCLVISDLENWLVLPGVQSLALRMTFPGQAKSVLRQNSSGGPRSRSLHFPPVLNSFKKKLKVTPFKPASDRSNLFLVSLAAFSILGALFIFPNTAKGQYDRTNGTCCLFCPFGEMLVI